MAQGETCMKRITVSKDLSFEISDAEIKVITREGFIFKKEKVETVVIADVEKMQARQMMRYGGGVAFWMWRFIRKNGSFVPFVAMTFDQMEIVLKQVMPLFKDKFPCEASTGYVSY